MTLAEKITVQIRENARSFVPARWAPSAMEMAAEVQRLAMENAGMRLALEALQKDEGRAKDMQAVRDACAAKVERAGHHELALSISGHQ